MKLITFLLVLVSGTAAVAARGEAGVATGVISYTCNDLVVIGRIKSLSYEHVDIKDDIMGHGWVTAQVRVRRVLAGRAKQRRLPVRYFAHAYFREDRDFLFVLSPTDAGGRVVRTAELLSANNRLAWPTAAANS